MKSYEKQLKFLWNSMKSDWNFYEKAIKIFYDVSMTQAQ